MCIKCTDAELQSKVFKYIIPNKFQIIEKLLLVIQVRQMIQLKCQNLND